MRKISYPLFECRDTTKVNVEVSVDEVAGAIGEIDTICQAG